MKKFIMVLFFVAVFICFECSAGRKNVPQNISNTMELSVEPGEYWKGKKKILFFTLDRMPQMAAWMENNQGMYISTLTVTNKGSKNSWISAPKEGRPEALPVWNHKIKNNISQIDSVSSATSKGVVDVKIDNSSFENGQEYNVYLEINHSFDFNETWPEKEKDVNGQPSLIYQARFIAGIPGKTKLIPIGHGSVDGSNGDIVKNLEGITTALSIIKEANIIVNQ
jgi:hypothetical protein